MSTSRRIIITGVSRGLGRALANELIALGHVVAGVARSASDIWDLQQSHGEPHHFQALDVTDERAVERWSATLLRDFGTPDMLINNAALINRNAPLWQVPPEEFRDLVNVNLVAVFTVTRLFVPAMIERGSGVIVNLSSGWGRSVAADMAPYCMSKWGIEGMTRALAADLPAGLAAIPLSPGIVATDMLLSTFGEQASQYPTPEQWAKTAAPFISSLGPEHSGVPLSTPDT